MSRSRRCSPRAVALAVFFSAALLAGLWLPAAGMAYEFTADTSWYTADPSAGSFELSSTPQLVGLQEIVNGTAEDAEGNPISVHDFTGQTIDLAADINFANLPGEQTVPIGGNGTGRAFNGTFDGHGHRVYGYRITSYGGAGIGLIGEAGADARITGVVVDHATITLGASGSSGPVIRDVGSLVGACAGSVSECTVTAGTTLTLTSSVPVSESEPANISGVGGLAGSVDGDLEDCAFAGTLTLGSPSDAYEDDNRVIDNVGGVAGTAGGDAPGTGVHGDVSGCVNDGTILIETSGSGGVDRFGQAVISQSANVGGIVGHGVGSVTGCVNNSPIDAENADGLGGIVGTLRIAGISGLGDWKPDPGTETDPLTIGDCLNHGALTGRHAVGGIVGASGSHTSVTRCLNGADADIAATRWNKPAGAGIAGQSFGDVSYCLNRADTRTVTGGGFYMAGIVGMLLRYTDSDNNFTSPQPEVYACYNTGTVVASGSFKQGSLVGQNDGYVHDCVFLEGSVLGKSTTSELELAIGDTDMVGIVRTVSMLSVAAMKDGTATAKLNALSPANGWSDHFLTLDGYNDGYPDVWQRIPDHETTDLSGAAVSLTSDARFSATFDPVPELNVTLDGTELTQGADFRVVARSGAREVTDSGLTPYTASVVGIGAYSGSITGAVSYGIDPGDFSTCVVTTPATVFNWEAQVPGSVTVYDAAGGVVDPDDYTYEVYGYNSETKKYEAGVACVNKRMNGYPVVATAREGTNYTGSTEYYADPNSLSKNAFIIQWADLYRDCEIEGFLINGKTYAWDKDAADFAEPVKVTYTGSEIQPTVVGLTYLGRTLTLSTSWNSGDYVYVYGQPTDLTNMNSSLDSNTNVSTGDVKACVTVRYRNGGNFTNYVNAFFEIVPAKISSATFDTHARKRTGKALKISAPIYNGMTLVEGTDYTITYSNNSAVGTATFKVTGKGNFTGSHTGHFTILSPDKVSTKVTVTGAKKVKRARTYKVKGKVTPGAASGRVKLVFKRYYKKKWRTVGTAKYVTLSKGAYSYKYKPKKRGKWRVYATYQGNTSSVPIYKASKSTYRGFKVK